MEITSTEDKEKETHPIFHGLHAGRWPKGKKRQCMNPLHVCVGSGRYVQEQVRDLGVCVGNPDSHPTTYRGIESVKEIEMEE